MAILQLPTCMIVATRDFYELKPCCARRAKETRSGLLQTKGTSWVAPPGYMLPIWHFLGPRWQNSAKLACARHPALARTMSFTRYACYCLTENFVFPCLRACHVRSGPLLDETVTYLLASEHPLRPNRPRQ
eukprot:6180826-Pleurochrysis_carterae.AAC.1